MNISKVMTLGGGLVALTWLSACKTTDGYTNANDPYGYYPPDGSAAAPYGAPGYGGYDPSAYPPPANAGYGNTGYGNSGNYYSESGEVQSIPGEAAGSSANTYAPVPGPAVPSSQTYTVVKGDNLYRIAKRFGISMQSIKDANGLTSTVIHPGQQLIIPQ